MHIIMMMMTQAKEQYASPDCELLEMKLEGVIAASLTDDEYETEKW